MNKILNMPSLFISTIILIICFSLFLVSYEAVIAEKPTNLDSKSIVSEKNFVKWSHPLNQNEDGRIFLDENGVALYDTTIVGGEYIGKQRNAVIIYRVANVFYNDFVENDNNTSKKLFMNNVNWLMENTVKYENYSIFEYSYKHGGYQLPSGWHDALGQGRIINLMLKAHNITNDNKYLNEAKLLSNAFFVEVSDGGLTYKTKNKGWWYEHYAHKDGLHPKVLNGMLFTLLDLYSLYQYTGDSDIKFLFDQGIIALQNDLPNYDFYGYTYYDSLQRSSGYHYQIINTQKSKILYEITNEEFLLEFHNKWKSCEEFCHFILKNVALLLREFEEIKQYLISESLLIILAYNFAHE